MTPARWTLIALLVASTALFTGGVIAERSSADTHTEPAGAHVGESGESAKSSGSAESEIAGVNTESTPLIVVAAVSGLGLAALTATRLGRRRAFLLAVAVIALAWAALDLREVVHQLDESHTGIAVIAILVTALHLAVALLAGAMSLRARQLDGAAPARGGTIPA